MAEHVGILLRRAAIAKAFGDDGAAIKAFEDQQALLAGHPDLIEQAQTTATDAQNKANSLKATPEFLVLTLTGLLANERKLTAGTGVAITDGGANGNATIEIDTVTDLGYTPANKAGDTFTGAINAPQVRITGGGGAPTLSTDTGVAGQIAWDATHIYVCVATNTWVRALLATF